jgi:UDP-N-acetylmuramate dehydrogenase
MLATKPYAGELLLGEPLADYTTWRVGGLAKALYKPASIADLSIFLQQLPAAEPILWLGFRVFRHCYFNTRLFE